MYASTQNKKIMFKKYEGDYNKHFYDVKTKDGQVFKNCWPNADVFHAECGSQIKGADVAEFKEVPFPC